VCVNQEVGNLGLDRRCDGFARAMREAGGSSSVLAIDPKDLEDARERLRAAASRPGVDGVLTLGSQPAEMAAEVAPLGATLGTFDYSPVVLRAVRTGRIEFAVDQQPYLQGYLPVVFLAERARYGLFPAQGEVVPTGPNFITSANAAQAERLSLLGIR
jgi:simple sugar transport system substrate-binding protein